MSCGSAGSLNWLQAGTLRDFVLEGPATTSHRVMMAQPPPDSSVFIAGDTYGSESAFRKAFATVRSVINDLAGVFYHIVVVTLSAAVAISLPTIARTFLTYWSKVEH